MCGALFLDPNNILLLLLIVRTVFTNIESGDDGGWRNPRSSLLIHLLLRYLAKPPTQLKEHRSCRQIVLKHSYAIARRIVASSSKVAPNCLASLGGYCPAKAHVLMTKFASLRETIVDRFR